MAMCELRTRKVQHRAPDDTSVHSEKHFLIATFARTDICIRIRIFQALCNGVSDDAMKSFGLIPFDHDARRCLLRAGNRTDFT
uniref:Uncharacterized protein n=1 Tax=Strigamia maritima TaxID=126957 RepID=T1IYM5_STRMM